MRMNRRTSLDLLDLEAIDILGHDARDQANHVVVRIHVILVELRALEEPDHCHRKRGRLGRSAKETFFFFFFLRHIM